MHMFGDGQNQASTAGQGAPDEPVERFKIIRLEAIPSVSVKQEPNRTAVLSLLSRKPLLQREVDVKASKGCLVLN